MLLAAPSRVLDDTGTPRFGLFRGPIADTSFKGLRLSSAGSLRRHLGEKRWTYVGVYGERVIAAFCIIDLTYLASAFAFTFERLPGAHAHAKEATSRLTEHHFIAPRFLPAVGDAPSEGHDSFGLPRPKLSIYADGLKRQVFGTLGHGHRRLDFDLWIDESPTDERPPEGLSLVAPQGPGAFGYTYKLAGLPVAGRLQIGGRELDLTGHRAIVDYTHGLPPRDTHWRWASAVGHLEGGARLALNLVSDWNTTPDPGGENAAWFDGALLPLAPVRFEETSESTWHLTSPQLEIAFVGEVQRKQHVNLGLISSAYTQPLGHFSGWILDAQGRRHDLVKVYGVIEDHHAHW